MFTDDEASFDVIGKVDCQKIKKNLICLTIFSYLHPSSVEQVCPALPPSQLVKELFYAPDKQGIGNKASEREKIPPHSPNLQPMYTRAFRFAKLHLPFYTNKPHLNRSLSFSCFLILVNYQIQNQWHDSNSFIAKQSNM